MRMGAAILVALVWTATTAQAQPIDNIGNAGQIVIGAERLTGVFVDNIEVKSTETQGGLSATVDAKVSTTNVSLFGSDSGSGGTPIAGGPTALPRLALDVFVTQGLSLGGSFIYLTRSGDTDVTVTVQGPGGTQTQTSDGKVPTATIFVIAPRIGYAYAFDDTFAIWPRVGFTYASVVNEDENETFDANGNPITVTETITLKQTNLTLEGLLVVSPFSHFALAGGPFFDVPLGGSFEADTTEPNVPTTDGDYTATAYGFTVGILAYF